MASHRILKDQRYWLMTSRKQRNPFIEEFEKSIGQSQQGDC